MKDQGMALGDFRFCYPYETCSQELKVRMAALNAVTGAQIRANLVRAAREAELACLEAIDQRVKAKIRAEAHDRSGLRPKIDDCSIERLILNSVYDINP